MVHTMKAWISTGGGEIAFGDLPIPSQAPDQALIQCKSTTVARGQVRHLPHTPEGRVLGLDLAGVVVKPAADGSGPPVGTRVIAMTGYSSGGWGQYAALPAGTLGVIPDVVDWERAALLPTAGLTALYSVRHGGFLVGRSVLVTGATGGVGRIAAQLCQLAGANVTGTVSRPERKAALSSLNLEQVVVGTDSTGPFDLIVDTIGGGVLGHALQIVGSEGVVVTVGGGDGFDAPPQPAIIPNEWFARHPQARLVAENVAVRVLQRTGVPRDLETLVKLVVGGRLNLDVQKVVSWSEIPGLISAMRAGQAHNRVAVLID